MAQSKELVLRVTIHDCDVQYFRGSGKGGQNRNKRDTACRVIHRPSGARAEAQEYRTQLENKRAAFTRMAKSSTFQRWAKIKALSLPSITEIVDEWMCEDNLVVETKVSGKWQPIESIE